MSNPEAPRIFPTFRYREPARMIDWLGKAFGFMTHTRFGEGDAVSHAELAFGASMIMIGAAKDDAFGAIVGQPGGKNGQAVYIAVEDIDHSRTKTKSPQTNGICERFHKTVLNEFYRIAFRKKVYRSIDDLQADLDMWIREYNEARPHQGRWCFGKTPMQTFLDAMPLTKEKMIAA